MYESALNYMFEDYEYTQYNITNLRRGVNLFQINKKAMTFNTFVAVFLIISAP